MVHIGDSCDLPSLSSYDKGRKSFQGKTYRQDINAHLEFQDRLWSPVLRRKKKLPRRIFCHGNHEQRINTTINISPELYGTISHNDLGLGEWYDDIVPYSGNTPGTIEVDGILYSHFLSSGISGRPVSGEHSGHALLGKYYSSATVGHSHLFDLCVRTRADGRKILGCTVGCYQDYTNDWAGEIGKLWDRGILIKRNVDQGMYDPQWLSMKAIKDEYA